MRLRLCLLILGGLFFSATAQEYAAGDQWSLFFWKRESGQTNNQGYYCGSTIENIYTQNNRTTIRGNARVDMPGWAELVLGNKAESQLVINRSRPKTVTALSSNLESAEWLETLNITMGNQTYVCNFLFPILGQGSAYKQGDHFTVTKDGVELLFTAVDDNLFVGKYSGSTQNAIYILTSSQHPMRIHSVEISGDSRAQAETYLGIDLGQFDNDAEAYGFDFVDTTLAFADTSITQTSRFDTSVTVSTKSDTVGAHTNIHDTTVTDTFLADSYIVDSLFTDTIMVAAKIIDTIITDTVVTHTTIHDTLIDDVSHADTVVVTTVSSDTAVAAETAVDTSVTVRAHSDTTAAGILTDCALPIQPDTSYTISWHIPGLDERLSVCTLSVDYVPAMDREVLMTTDSASGSFQWYVPGHSDSATLRLTVYDTENDEIVEFAFTAPILNTQTAARANKQLPGNLALHKLRYDANTLSIALATPFGGAHDIAAAVYTPQGRLLHQIKKSTRLMAGYHTLELNKAISNGTYVVRVRLSAPAQGKNVSDTQMMTIVK